MTNERAKHTPGPWEVRAGFLVIEAGDSVDRPVVAQASGSNMEANAALIADAPAMLEALGWMMEAMQDARAGRAVNAPRVDHARALLRKHEVAS